MTTNPALRDAMAHLGLLFARRAGLIELRAPAQDGMRQQFHAVEDGEAAARRAVALAARRDVYVGVLPRRRPRGRRQDLVAQGDVAWVDLDDADLIKRLLDFVPAPSLVIASGSAGHRHVYWRLSQPADLSQIEALNEGLATALGGDRGSADAARVLRLAGTRNHKRNRQEPVTIEYLDATQRVSAETLPRQRRRRPQDRVSQAAIARRRDPLRSVPPAVFVEALTGQRPGRDGKICCPFHEDERPSLHVYRDPERGWYCFGCGRGGSIYDFAAMLWDRPLRGGGFLELRRDLAALLASGRAVTGKPPPSP